MENVNYKKILHNILEHAGLEDDSFHIRIKYNRCLFECNGHSITTVSGSALDYICIESNDFLWKFANDKNELTFILMSGNSDISASVFDSKLDLCNEAFKCIVAALMKNGAKIVESTTESSKIDAESYAWIKSITSSKNVSLSKSAIWKEVARREKMVNDAKKTTYILKKPYSCIEELMIDLEMDTIMQ